MLHVFGIVLFMTQSNIGNMQNSAKIKYLKKNKNPNQGLTLDVDHLPQISLQHQFLL